MYLLPRDHPATKKIMESSPAINCDIYDESPAEPIKQQIDDFIRFIETSLNKLKKVHCQRNTRVSTSSLSAIYAAIVPLMPTQQPMQVFIHDIHIIYV